MQNLVYSRQGPVGQSIMTCISRGLQRFLH